MGAPHSSPASHLIKPTTVTWKAYTEDYRAENEGACISESCLEGSYSPIRSNCFGLYVNKKYTSIVFEPLYRVNNVFLTNTTGLKTLKIFVKVSPSKFAIKLGVGDSMVKYWEWSHKHLQEFYSHISI